jgi:hypothetical protein
MCEDVPNVNPSIGIRKESQEKNNNIQPGFCQCGCGGKVKKWPQSYTALGVRKGDYKRFIIYHHTRKESKADLENNQWLDKRGYWHTFGAEGRRFKHIVICEEVLGKPLPPKAEVHHVDENKGNNKNNNLVICQDSAYHKLLHQRMRALKACGHADWLKCTCCKQYDSPEKIIYGHNRVKFHRKCKNIETAKRRKIKRHLMMNMKDCLK